MSPGENSHGFSFRWFFVPAFGDCLSQPLFGSVARTKYVGFPVENLSWNYGGRGTPSPSFLSTLRIDHPFCWGGSCCNNIYTPKNLTARTLKMMVFQKESPFPGIYSIFRCYVKFRGSIYPPHKAFGETSKSNMSQVNILWRQPDLSSSSMFFVNLFRENCWNSNCKTSPTNWKIWNLDPPKSGCQMDGWERVPLSNLVGFKHHPSEGGRESFWICHLTVYHLKIPLLGIQIWSWLVNLPHCYSTPLLRLLCLLGSSACWEDPAPSKHAGVSAFSENSGFSPQIIPF